MRANAEGSDRARRGADRARAGVVLGGLALAAAVALPAGLAGLHLSDVADAAHDGAVVRALGLGWTGAWRGLDAVVYGLFAWVPLGTRATRAALASAAVAGVAGGVLFTAARALLARCVEEVRTRDAVAAIASLAATLSAPWQTEAASPAGSGLGAVLGLSPIALLVGTEAPLALVAFATGLALSYEPLVGVAAIASVAGYFAASERDVRRAAFVRGELPMAGAAFVLGLAPFALAFARRGSPLALAVGAFASAAGERGESGAGILPAFLRDDFGLASSMLVIGGVGLSVVAPRARAALAGLAAVAVVGATAMVAGAPAGPTRYGSVVLAGVGAAYAVAAVALQALVVAIGNARVPFARASAAMVLVLEAALPARAADDASARADDRPWRASETWLDAACGPLPAGAAVLVRDPRVEARLYAARAAGELRADLALVPLFDLGGRGALRELARDAKLEPIWRDAALVGSQEEWSLSSLAEERPLVAPYDPAWDRTLARHLVPVGLFARFAPEPRGGSDRRKALDEFSAGRERLVRGIEGDPELLGATATLLRARAIALAAAAERDVVAHAIDDLRPFSPRDPVAAEIVRRVALARGPIDVKDLAP